MMIAKGVIDVLVLALLVNLIVVFTGEETGDNSFIPERNDHDETDTPAILTLNNEGETPTLTMPSDDDNSLSPRQDVIIKLRYVSILLRDYYSVN